MPFPSIIKHGVLKRLPGNQVIIILHSIKKAVRVTAFKRVG